MTFIKLANFNIIARWQKASIRASVSQLDKIVLTFNFTAKDNVHNQEV